MTTVENEFPAWATPAAAKAMVIAANEVDRITKNIWRALVEVLFRGRGDLLDRVRHDDRLWLIAVISII